MIETALFALVLFVGAVVVVMYADGDQGDEPAEVRGAQRNAEDEDAEIEALLKECDSLFKQSKKHYDENETRGERQERLYGERFSQPTIK